MTTIDPEELVNRTADMYGVRSTPERASDFIDMNPHAGPTDFYYWLLSMGEGESADGREEGPSAW